MAATAISGGAVVLNDFQVSGLVQSLLVVTNELIESFHPD